MLQETLLLLPCTSQLGAITMVCFIGVHKVWDLFSVGAVCSIKRSRQNSPKPQDPKDPQTFLGRRRGFRMRLRRDLRSARLGRQRGGCQEPKTHQGFRGGPLGFFCSLSGRSSWPDEGTEVLGGSDAPQPESRHPSFPRRWPSSRSPAGSRGTRPGSSAPLGHGLCRATCTC